MKTRSKIVLILVSIFLSLILLFSGFIYFFISRYSFQDFYERLETRSISTAKSELEDHSDTKWVKRFKKEYLQRLPEERNYILEVKPHSLLESLARRHKLPAGLLLEIDQNKLGTYRENSVLYCGIRYDTHGKTYFVITSARNYYFLHYMAYLRTLLVVSISASMILVVLISYWVSRKLITPIRRITDQMNHIGTENLNLRLEGAEAKDELGELVLTFNNMLDRLETSFETQNNFISNASHELNTPLTSIIGEADVALTRSRSEAEYVETLQNILEEAEKLDKKTKALLFLAQTGFNGKAMQLNKVRMDQLVLDVQGTINRIYPDNQVRLDFSLLPEDPMLLKVHGNEQLLHLAVSNIIVNACKYSSNSEVSVSLSHVEGFVVLRVQDLGIGIPAQEIRYIYDPFFRASNTGNFEGYGIGLPLTRNIVRLHKGEMQVRSASGSGTEVEIRIPVGKFPKFPN
jgi:signal transduction histidine kinase